MGKIDQIKCFVLDMDGTIYLEGELFSFTKGFLKRVEETGRKYYFSPIILQKPAGLYR